jgi:hypothetical protein
MKALYTFIMLVFFIFESKSQGFFTEVKFGTLSYAGDLQDKPLIPQMLRPAFSVGFNYEFHPKLLLASNLTYGKIAGDDKYNSSSKARNLRFESSITEFSIGIDYNFLDLYKHKFSPFIQVSFAVYKFNPYVDIEDGNRLYLAEYSTEGQGFYKGREKYKLTQYAIPYGAGIQYAVSPNLRIGVLVSSRKLFTDYIDDCSTTYVDSLLLSRNVSTYSPILAYQGALLSGANPYPQDGALRGNPANNDSYSFLGLFVKFRFVPKGKREEYGGNGLRKVKTNCPTVF